MVKKDEAYFVARASKRKAYREMHAAHLREQRKKWLLTDKGKEYLRRRNESSKYQERRRIMRKRAYAKLKADPALYSRYLEKMAKYQKAKREPSPRMRLSVTRSNAAIRGREWGMTDEHALKLITSPCHYCGEMKELNGIDRVDNAIGYLTTNCVPCCKHCNRMKWTMPLDEFIERCRRVANWIVDCG